MTRRLPWLLGTIVLVVAIVVGTLMWRSQAAAQGDRAARAAATAFATAWQSGRLDSVAYAAAAPADVQRTYQALTKGLAGARPTVQLRALNRTGETAAGSVQVGWALPGGDSWEYDLPVRLQRAGGRWVVANTPAQSLFAPIPATSTLRLLRAPAKRAEVLGPQGQAIVTERPVVDVGVQPSRVKGTPTQLASTLAAIVDVQAPALAARITAAKADAFVDVITLRRSDYDPLRARLKALPGVVFRERSQSLGPTRDFARALLGSVGPVTAEMVAAGKGRYIAGDRAGLSGLQRRYDERLGGRAGVSIMAVGADGGPAQEVFTRPASAGQPVTTTLDSPVQRAADAALAGAAGEAALVAVSVQTGAVLAVANSPASGLNRALVGRYPPGSTFKVVSTLALLTKGLRPTDTVNCPLTATVQGRAFRNYEGEQLGPVPFRTDFAQSCNTAFVGLSSRLGDDDLTATARALGIGDDWSLGVDAYSGNVPRTTSPVDKAAATFGQGRILVSPIALAVATASVARGSYLPPTLVTEPAPTEQPTATPLPAEPTTTLRALMREVVTNGTGTALTSVPGPPVSAKSGTAEFGSARPPLTHAWITGWQGDVAFAVFVGTGKSGGTVAGPVAARFLTALAGT